MKKPKVLVLCAAGTNGDLETAEAFSLAGGSPERVPLGFIKSGKKRLMDYDLLVLPDGFSYGDAAGAGKVWASQIKLHLKELRLFIRAKRPVLGISNCFQALVRAGMLPFSHTAEQTASFVTNDSGLFETRWVHLRINAQSSCLFFKGLPEMVELPVAHGEGRLVLKSPRQLEDLKKNKSIAMQYVSDDGKLAEYPFYPNGSVFSIAALSNPEGNCLGMMPHPERYTTRFQHPNWTRQTFVKDGVGLAILRNAVDYCRGLSPLRTNIRSLRGSRRGIPDFPWNIF